MRLKATAAAALCALTSCAAALAGNDEGMARDIRANTDKLHQEMTTKAAELRSKREWPKSGPLTQTAPSCAHQAPVQPFRAWGDSADYTLLPGGTFEQSHSGWKFENTARVIAGNTSFGPGQRVLLIPKGAKVTTAPLCITEFHPTIRFHARYKGSPGSRLRVEVLYEDLGGSVNTLTIGWLRATPAWAPSTIVSIGANVRAAVAQSKTAAVAFQFTVEGDDGEWYVDDVYVDPFKSN